MSGAHLAYQTKISACLRVALVCPLPASGERTRKQSDVPTCASRQGMCALRGRVERSHVRAWPLANLRGTVHDTGSPTAQSPQSPQSALDLHLELRWGRISRDVSGGPEERRYPSSERPKARLFMFQLFAKKFRAQRRHRRFKKPRPLTSRPTQP